MKLKKADSSSSESSSLQPSKIGVIVDVGNGAIRIRSGKEESDVSYVAFRDSWCFVYDKDELKQKGLVLNWSETLASSNESILLARAWGRVCYGLELAQEWVTKQGPLPTLTIQTKPNKKLFVEQDAIAARTLFLLPHSSNFAFETSNSKGKFTVSKEWVQTSETISGKHIFIKPQFSMLSASVTHGSALTEPFWCVRKVDGMPEEGNMELVNLASEGHATSVAMDKKKLVQTMRFTTPCLVNTLDVKPGDELIWAFPQPAPKRNPVPVKAKESKKKKEAVATDEL